MLDLSLGPFNVLSSEFDCGQTPVFAMIVSLSVFAPSQPGSFQGLVVGQASEDTENDGDSRVETDTHEGVRDGIANVLKVHRGSLDQSANRNGRGEWAGGDGGTSGSRVGGVGTTATTSIKQVDEVIG